MTTDHEAVFARAVAAGEVWVSGLGTGAGGADVQVLADDWTGGAELARELFYRGLDSGQLLLDRARVVPGHD